MIKRAVVISGRQQGKTCASSAITEAMREILQKSINRASFMRKQNAIWKIRMQPFFGRDWLPPLKAGDTIKIRRPAGFTTYLNPHDHNYSRPAVIY